MIAPISNFLVGSVPECKERVVQKFCQNLPLTKKATCEIGAFVQCQEANGNYEKVIDNLTKPNNN